MKLRVVIRDAWTVLAVYIDEERCDVLDFANGLRRDDPPEFARLMRAFERLSASGPSRNKRLSRALPHDIVELKARGGVRVLYFFDEGRVIVCSEAMRKPKPRGLAQAVERAAPTRWRSLSDKRRNDLRIIEDR